MHPDFAWGREVASCRPWLLDVDVISLGKDKGEDLVGSGGGREGAGGCAVEQNCKIAVAVAKIECFCLVKEEHCILSDPGLHLTHKDL